MPLKQISALQMIMKGYVASSFIDIIGITPDSKCFVELGNDEKSSMKNST